MSCDQAHLDGVYVLGSLSPDERAAFERHLADCDECSRGVRDLAGLPGLLARVPEDVLHPTAAPPVPPTLLPALLREVRRRRRATRLVAVAVAAAVIVAGAVVGVMVGNRPDDGTAAAPPPAASTAPAERMTSAAPDAIAGWISLTEVGWGTRIDLTCSYGGQSEAEWTYVMIVRTTDGAVEEVGTRRATPGEESQVSMATAATPDEIASVVVETGTGAPVLTLTR